MADCRTTPRWLQPIAAAFLLVCVGYFTTANLWALEKDSAPAWVKRNPAYTWFGGWKMFTYRDEGHALLEAEVLVDGEWREQELLEVFPYRWESGPRYARSSFWRSGNAVRVLAQATCGRLEEQGEDVQRVRFTEARWRKTLGSNSQPRRNKRLKTKTVLEWHCKQTWRLPKGRLL